MESPEQIKELEAQHTKNQKNRLLSLRDEEGQLLNIQGQGQRHLNVEEKEKLSELRNNIRDCETELRRLGLNPATMTFEDVT